MGPVAIEQGAGCLPQTRLADAGAPMAFDHQRLAVPWPCAEITEDVGGGHGVGVRAWAVHGWEANAAAVECLA